MGTQPRNSQENSNTSHIASTHEKATALAVLGKQLDIRWVSMFTRVNYFLSESKFSRWEILNFLVLWFLQLWYIFFSKYVHVLNKELKRFKSCPQPHSCMLLRVGTSIFSIKLISILAALSFSHHTKTPMESIGFESI